MAFPPGANTTGGPSVTTGALQVGEGPRLILSAELRDEDNPFRLAPTANVAALLGTGDRADRLAVVTVGLRYDKTWSLQRVELALDAAAYRYQTFSRYDFNASDYLAAWHWHLTPRLSGTLSATRTETLRNYSDFSNFSIRNLLTEERQQASADWWLAGSWHLVGGVSASRSRNSEAITAVVDDVRDVAEAGVRYVSAANNVAAFLLRHARGHYEGRAADPFTRTGAGFVDREAEARVGWASGAGSRLDGRAGWLERRHEDFGERDYSGPVGRLTALWRMAPKTSVSVTAGRALYSFQEFANSYYVVRDVGITPTWAATEKTALALQWQRVTRSFRGAIVPVGTLREDRIRTVGAAATWTPTQRSQARLYWSRERRDSNYAAFDYRARVIGLAGQISF